MRELRRLVFDIETSPCIMWLWKPGYNIDVPWTNMIREPAVICISYKWVGEKKTHHLQWDEHQDDKTMLETFIPIMQEADIVIGHNSDQFDVKWLRTRCIKHGIDMPPDFVTIDTYKDAKRYFRFNSNSLKYIAQFLGVREKRETPKDLWQDVVFQDSKKAMKEMLRYCDRDVEATEDVFVKMIPYVKATGHVGDYMVDCPHCGSSRHTWPKPKDRISAAGAVRSQFQCQDCGKYHTVAKSSLVKNKPIKR